MCDKFLVVISPEKFVKLMIAKGNAVARVASGGCGSLSVPLDPRHVSSPSTICKKKGLGFFTIETALLSTLNSVQVE